MTTEQLKKRHNYLFYLLLAHGLVLSIMVFFLTNIWWVLGFLAGCFSLFVVACLGIKTADDIFYQTIKETKEERKNNFLTINNV